MGLQPTQSNPFFNLAMIRNAKMFFGRTDLLQHFYDAIENRQSVSLLGSHHIGKSSFLWCAALPEIQAHFLVDLSHHIFVFLDLREYLHKTSEDFFHRVSKEVISQSAKVAELHMHIEGTGEDAFSSVLDQLAEHGYFPVLLLDAFDNLTRNKHFGPEFLAFLRAHASMGLVSYVTASTAPLYEVCHHDIADSPFFNIFYTYTLEAMTPEEAGELINVPAREAGLPFTDMEVVLLRKLAGRHPFFIQRVCYALFREKLMHSDGEIDVPHLKQVVYKDLQPHFQDTWDRLSEEQQKLLLDEAQRKGDVLRKLPEFSESSLFRQFVRNICHMKLFQMTVDELANTLEQLDDLKVLGDANLRLMEMVSSRLTKSSVSSPIEKGIVVREVLYEAFERLRGIGVRSDSAPGWRLYNILYYRYFKYHLKNEPIATRLGLSTRQYYRERDKAIEALLNILLEMEYAPAAQK